MCLNRSGIVASNRALPDSKASNIYKRANGRNFSDHSNLSCLPFCLNMGLFLLWFVLFLKSFLKDSPVEPLATGKKIIYYNSTSHSFSVLNTDLKNDVVYFLYCVCHITRQTHRKTPARLPLSKWVHVEPWHLVLPR